MYINETARLQADRTLHDTLSIISLKALFHFIQQVCAWTL